MRRVIFTLLTIFAVTSIANAQVNTDVIIKLKSGIELRGDIMEEVPGQSITVRTPEGDLFYYSIDEVLKIEDPNIVAKRRAEEERLKQEKIDARLQVKENRRLKREELSLGNYVGYKGIFEFTFGTNFYAVRTESMQGSITFINGVNLGAHCYIGVGVGMEYVEYGYYDYHDGSYLQHSYHLAVPVFLNLRIPFVKNSRVTPYFSINGGYSFGLTDMIAPRDIYSDYWNGTIRQYEYANSSAIYAEPAFGMEIRCKKRSSVFFAVSAPIYVRNFGTSNVNAIYNFGAKLGFSF